MLKLEYSGWIKVVITSRLELEARQLGLALVLNPADYLLKIPGSLLLLEMRGGINPFQKLSKLVLILVLFKFTVLFDLMCDYLLLMFFLSYRFKDRLFHFFTELVLQDVVD